MGQGSNAISAHLEAPTRPLQQSAEDNQSAHGSSATIGRWRTKRANRGAASDRRWLQEINRTSSQSVSRVIERLLWKPGKGRRAAALEDALQIFRPVHQSLPTPVAFVRGHVDRQYLYLSVVQQRGLNQHDSHAQ